MISESVRARLLAEHLDAIITDNMPPFDGDSRRCTSIALATALARVPGWMRDELIDRILTRVTALLAAESRDRKQDAAYRHTLRFASLVAVTYREPDRDLDGAR